MVSAKTLAVLFPNVHDETLGELTAQRTAASIPYGGRYRLIDFPLSGLSYAGVEQVAMVVRKNYVSLMDHIGSGREWDLGSKTSGVRIYPPFSSGKQAAYIGKVDALNNIINYLSLGHEEYVVLADCNIVATVDYRELLAEHRKSGADITAVYAKRAITREIKEDNFTFGFDKKNRCTQVLCNDFHSGICNVSLSVYVIKRSLLVELIRDAYSRNTTFFERDVLAKNVDTLNIQGYEYKGFLAFITDKKSFFDANLSLLREDNMQRLFTSDVPVYTKVTDEAPARYTVDGKAKDCIIGDGSLIAGVVENSVLFRGVKISKGATVKNCVLMQNTVVGAGAAMNYVVTDKDVTVQENVEIKGTEVYPVFVKKGETV